MRIKRKALKEYFVLVDRKYTILAISETLLKPKGLKLPSVLGRSINELWNDPTMLNHVYTNLTDAYAGQIVSEKLELPLLNEKLTWYSIKYLPIVAGNREEMSILISWRDISAEESKIQKLISELRTDPLTKTLNRRTLFEDMDSLIRRQKVFYVMMLDLDNFKCVNDRFGHDEGDKLLREIGKTFTQELLGKENLYRYGGDEFVIIGTEIAIDLVTHGNKIIERFATTKYGQKYGVGISIGVNIFDGKKLEDSIDILKKADKQMYKSKRSGKNKITT